MKAWIRIILLAFVLISLTGCDQEYVQHYDKIIFLAEPSGGNIFLDEVEIGQTPLVWMVEEGVHDLRIDTPGCEVWSETFIAKGDREHVIDARLIPLKGSLVVETSAANATVEVNGELKSAPALFANLEPGMYLISVQAEGYHPKQAQIAVVQNQETRLDLDLEVFNEKPQEPDINKIRLLGESLVNDLVKPLQAAEGVVVGVEGKEVYLHFEHGQGRVGSLFEIASPGVLLLHPQTGEPLGTTEKHKGLVELERVRETYSIARTIESHLPMSTDDLAFEKVDEKKIAVARFSSPGSPNSMLTWFLQESIVTLLAVRPELQVIERQQLDKVFAELKLGQTGVLDEATIREIGKVLGVELLIIGSVADLNESYEIYARIVDTETGAMLTSSLGTLNKGADLELLWGRQATEVYPVSDYRSSSGTGNNSSNVVDDLIGKTASKPWPEPVSLDLNRQFAQPKRTGQGVAWLGIGYKIAYPKGVLVESVLPYSPADKAGLQKSDLILKIGGQAVEGTDLFSESFGDCTIGSQIELTVERQGQQARVSVTLEAKPPSAWRYSKRIDIEQFDDFAISPDSRYIAILERDRDIRIIDTFKDYAQYSISARAGSATCLAWSPDSKYIVTGNEDKTLRILDRTTGSLLKVLSAGDLVTKVLWSRTGQYLAVGTKKGATRGIQVWDLHTDEKLWNVDLGNSDIRTLVWSPVDDRLLSVRKEEIVIWDGFTGKRLQVFPGGYDAAWGGEGTEIATVNGYWQIWDLKTGLLLQKGGSGGESIAFFRDGQSVMTISSSHSQYVYVYDRLSGSLLREIDGYGFYKIGIAPDNSYFVCIDHYARYYDLLIYRP